VKPPPPSPPAVAAAVWALLFALNSAYWAAGGTAGAHTVANDLAQQAADREPGIVAALWAATVLKLLLAGLALALARPRGRPLRLAGWIAGGLLLLYGLVNWGEFVLMAVGAIAVPESVGEDAVPWYVFLWEPVWILGGLLFLAAARAARA
jgi:Protein of unknown function (DUF3995)